MKKTSTQIIRTLVLLVLLVVLFAATGYYFQPSPQTNNIQFEPKELNQQMTVTAAYQAIPHRRTFFDIKQSKIDQQSANTLHSLFNWTDKAVVERVENLQAMFDNNRERYRAENYRMILDALQSLRVPRKIGQAHALIIEAVREQQSYFDQLHVSDNKIHFNTGHPLIQSSHKKLLDAYNQLMLKFPHENAKNRQAFFDHLCALDFI